MNKRKNSLKNLIPINKRSPEERREIQSKGSYGRSKSIAKKKLLKEELLEELSKERSKGVDGFTAMVKRQIDIAINSEDDSRATKAFEVIRDTIGQKPKEEVEMTVNSYEDTLKELQDVLEDDDEDVKEN